MLALKNGVPAVALDPVAGGAKISRQAAVVGWPLVFTPDALDAGSLQDALDFALTEDARREARACAERARSKLAEVEDETRAALTGVPPRSG